MKRIFPLFIFLFIVVTTFTARPAFGCSCARSAPCKNFGNADTVFVGRVVGSKFQEKLSEGTYTKDADGNYVSGEPVEVSYDVGEVYFEVDEAFRGTEKGAKVTIFSGTGGGDCGYWFRRGESYIVFASRVRSNKPSGFSSMTGGSSQNLKADPARLWTTICSGTRPLADGTDALRFLRNLPAKGDGGMILGSIYQSVKDLNDSKVTNMAMTGTRVTAREIGGARRSFFGTVDTSGLYEIKVPPGRYVVTPEIGPNLTFRDGPTDKNPPIVIADTRCELRSFWVRNDSEISGRIVGSDGRPAGLLTIELIPANLNRDEESFDYEFNISESNGTFAFYGIPAGRYQLSLNYMSEPEDDEPIPTTFYPLTGVRADAQVFEIGPGTNVKNLVFKLPPKLLKQRISGIVVDKDGVPIVGAEVSLVDVEFDRDVFFNKPLTDLRGRFSVEAFEGRKYKINVLRWKARPEGGEFATHEAESGIFTLEAKTAPFRLELKKIDPAEKSITRSTVRAN